MEENEKKVDRVALGVGEVATIRLPTSRERTTLNLNGTDPVLVISHVDRNPDIIPALDVSVVPRPYGIGNL